MKRSDQNGFTLPELITTIVIISIAFLTVFMIFNAFTKNYTTIEATTENIQRIQQTTRFLDSEIKNLRNKNSILIATSSRFQFINVNNANVDILFTGNQLKKGNVIICSDIGSASITYYRWDGSLWNSSRPTSEIALVNFNISYNIKNIIIPVNHSILLRNNR